MSSLKQQYCFNNSDREMKKTASRLALLLVLLNSPTVLSDQVTKNTVFRFDIESGDLAKALSQFAETTNTELSYPADIVEKRTAEGLKGKYTEDQALKTLLKNTDITYRVVDDKVIALEAPKYHSLTTESLLAAAGEFVLAEAEPEEEPYTGPVEQMEMTVSGGEWSGYNVLNASTATKTDTPLILTPASIHVISKDVMNDQQNINVLDSLNRNVSGVIAKTGASLSYDNFIVRGFSIGTNGTAYRNGLFFPTNYYEPANIEQLEVLKGPAAALYGRIEPGGLINFTTKKPLAKPYYSLQQQFGSYDLYRTTLDVTGPIDDAKTLLYRFNAAYIEKESFRDVVNSERIFLAPTLSWRPNDRFEANLELEYKHDNFVNDYGIPVANGATRPVNLPDHRFLGEPGEQMEQEYVLVAYDWTYRFDDAWKITNRFLWEDWSQKMMDINSMGLQADNRTLNRGLVYGSHNWETYATNLDLTGHFDLLGMKHEILVGIDFYHNKYPGSSMFFGATDAVPPIDIYNPVYGQVDWGTASQLQKNFFMTRRDLWYGVYFQDQITLWDKLHILGGGRYDWSSSGNTTSRTSVEEARNNFSDIEVQNFTPRVGILYQPWEWLSVYGNFSQSFDRNRGMSFSGEQFEPQLGEQFEAGLKTEFFDRRLSASFAYYHLTKSNIVTADLDHRGFNATVGEARSQGIEFEVNGQLTEQLNLIATYAYTDTKVLKDNRGREGNKLENVPEHQGTLWGTYQVTERFKVGLGGVAVGSRQGDANNSFQLPGYVRLDTMAAYTQPIGKTRLTAQVNINNVLDKEYYSDSGFGERNTVLFGQPITVMGSLRLEY